MKNYHYAVCNLWPLKPMTTRDHYADLWGRLKRRFPKIWACTLMPDHVHISLESAHPEATKRILATELRAFTRQWYPGKKLWAKVPQPKLIQNSIHLARSIRYVHLNPCRDRFTTDPLSWEWSTHRDALGLAHPIWLDLPRIKRQWELNPGEDFATEFHKYVSGDPSTHVAGTPMPVTKPPNAVTSLQAIIHSVRVATRSPVKLSSVNRKVAVHLAKRLATVTPMQIAEALGMSRSGVHKILSSPLSVEQKEILHVAVRVLSDPRLLGQVPSGKPSGS